MHIAVLGAGPAGLYFAYLWKQRHPEAKIEVFEQNPADATWGFGVCIFGACSGVSARRRSANREDHHQTNGDVAGRRALS